MSKEPGLYLERRSSPRIPYRYTIRFVSNPSHPLKLSPALSHNLSLRGLQFLASSVPDLNREFDIWIPTHNEDVVHARARLKWTALEVTFSDSPYWIRCGVEVIYINAADRKIISKLVEKKASQERSSRENQLTKIGYIF
jgi:hypothetical protein